MSGNGRVARVPEGADKLRDRIERWRLTRTKLGPMPGELWEAAVALASRDGVFAVSRAVGVEYSTLRRRVEAQVTGEDGVPEAAVAPAFVELRASMTGASPACGETWVELSDGGGARMTIRVAASAALDVAQVVSAFWARAR